MLMKPNRILFVLSVLLVGAIVVSPAFAAEQIWQFQSVNDDFEPDQFGDLGGVAVDRDNIVYIADGQKGIYVVDADNGEVVDIIRNSDIDATDVAIRDGNTLWVADNFDNHLFIINKDGDILETIGQRGNGEGDFGAFSPSSIAVAPNGDVYVSDIQEDSSGFDVGRIQVFTEDGDFRGAFPTDPSDVGMSGFQTIAIGGDQLYVADGVLGLVSVFALNGELQAVNILQDDLQYIGVDTIGASDDGTVFVATQGSIFHLDPNGRILDDYGSFQSNSSEFGAGEFSSPQGIGILGNGDAIVADTNGNYSQIVRIRFN